MLRLVNVPAEETQMSSLRTTLFMGLMLVASTIALAQTNTPDNPSWWNKYQYLSTHAASPNAGSSSSAAVGPNVDVSNECGPQSETYVTVNTSRPKNLAGGSNEIFRDPMRAYASFDNGASWTGVDAPLPPPLSGTNDIRFGSDPSLVFDTRGNLFYSYIVVFFGGGNGINGTELAVAKSTDGGKTYPAVNYFSFEGGENHFNDKPMITTDTNAGSAFRDNVYIAWDAAVGGSIGGGVRLATSSDHGATFSGTRVDDPSWPGRSIGASPSVGPNGEVYVAWNDYAANAIVFNSSYDGGRSWGVPVTISTKTLPFDIGIPAESFRGALVYPSLGVDVSNGPHRGRIYCSWMDLTPANVTDIFISFSDNNGQTWSAPAHVPDQFGFPVDRFNHWMSIDPTNGDVNVAFYDTRNDTTGARYQTDYYLARSTDGGVSFPATDLRFSTVR